MFFSSKQSPWFYNKNFLAEYRQLLRGIVVDVGCGTLKYKNLVIESPNVERYVGVDFYETNGVDVVANLNEGIPLPDEFCDAAICISVIEHLAEPEVAIREMYRILKPGGHVLLATPWEFPFHHEPSDFYRFSRYALEHLFKKAGFEIILIRPTGGKFHVVLNYIQRWFPRLKRLVRFLERFVPRVNEHATTPPLLNTSNHQVVAIKR